MKRQDYEDGSAGESRKTRVDALTSGVPELNGEVKSLVVLVNIE